MRCAVTGVPSTESLACTEGPVLRPDRMSSKLLLPAQALCSSAQQMRNLQLSTSKQHVRVVSAMLARLRARA
jgi:hypothetical protein